MYDYIVNHASMKNFL